MKINDSTINTIIEIYYRLLHERVEEGNEDIRIDKIGRIILKNENFKNDGTDG